MDEITTRSTSSETMDIDPIVLRETGTTRLVFKPIWVSSSSNPLRGGFRFQKKSSNDTWEDAEAKTMQNIKKDEGYQLNLKPEEILSLLKKLQEIAQILEKHGHTYGERTILLSSENAKGVFLQIASEQNREWIISELRKLESENFENLGDAIGRAKLENIIKSMEDNMQNEDEGFWQSLFENQPWILQQLFAQPVMWLSGETYLGGKSASGRQGRGGVATDSLLRNISNGSFAVVEIKTPGTRLIGSQYRGDYEGETNLTYQIHGDLSGAVVQMENQIVTAREQFQAVLQQSHNDINRLYPHGILIVGNYSSLSIDKQKSFDLFRNALGVNIILTFDEVLMKVKGLKSLYEYTDDEIIDDEIKVEDIPF